MKFHLARAVLLVMTVATTVVGAYAFWTQPGTFDFDQPSLYGLSLGPLVVATLGVIASFAPFDSARSTYRWTCCLAGTALGVAVGGLVLFTPSFLVLAPLLIAYGVVLRRLGRVVASGNPDVEEDDAGHDPSDPFGHGTTVAVANALDDSEHAAEKDRGAVALLVLFTGLGIALTWCWLPGSAGARPLPLDARVEPAFEPPEAQPQGRVTHDTRKYLVEVEGHRVSVRISLRRPMLVVTLRRHTVILQPCLTLEEATIDGFFAVPLLNVHTLAPGATEAAPAQVETVEGKRRGWVRVTYGGQSRTDAASAAGYTAFLGRRANGGDMSAVVEVEVDFISGRVTVDARTTLTRDAAVHLGTLSRVELRDAKVGAPVRFGLGDDTQELFLATREDGAWRSPLEFLVADGVGGVTRHMQARRGGSGPFETLSAGALGGWFVLPGAHEPLLLLAPDWTQQASLQRSRSAGHGLFENAAVGWWEDERLTLAFDLAGTRIGGGTLSTLLPPGIYRNRLVLQPVGTRTGPEVAARELARLRGTER